MQYLLFFVVLATQYCTTINRSIIIIIISVLPKGRSFTASAGTKVAVLPKAGLPLQTQEPRLQFYQGLNKCGSFLLLSKPHSLFSIWTDLKRSENIPRAPTRRWQKWICLAGPSRLRRNSPQELNISSIRVFDQIRDLQIPITFCPQQEHNKIENIVVSIENAFIVGNGSWYFER